MPPIVGALGRALGPWQSLYGDSKFVSTTVVAVHVVATLLGGGLAVAADRTTLRALRPRATGGRAVGENARLLAELGAVHRPVLLGLVALFVSGVLLAAADVKTYWASWVFWLKLALVALLLVNGLVLERAEAGLRRSAAAGSDSDATAWGRLRATAWVSLLLWTATTVVGVALTSAA